MHFAAIFRGLVVSVAVLGICFPQPLLASPPVKQSPVAGDIALGKGGVFLGQVVDANGAVTANVPVSLRQGDRELAQARTDAGGHFAFSGLRGGVYQIAVAEGVTSYRVWAERTAPPKTKRTALVVSGQDLVRGQLRFLLASPWVVAGIVATSVAVPVGIHNASKFRPSSP